MDTIRILAAIHTPPHVNLYLTQFVSGILPALKSKTGVNMIWLVYQPDKIDKPYENDDSNTIILDIHDYKNAIELVQKSKPDVIYADASYDLINYALSTAAKFFDIPTFSIFISDIAHNRGQADLIKSYMTRFFENSIPTDTEQNKRQFMRRGRFFLYKYLFLLKTQKTSSIGIFRILYNFFLLLKLFLTETKYVMDPRFSTTIHFVESENLIEPLVNAGFNRSSLILTGNPIYDKIFQKLETLQSSVKRNDEVIRVLFAPTTLYEHGYQTREQRDTTIKKIVTEILAHKKKISLVVKIHPATAVFSEYQSLIHSLDTGIPIYQKGDFIEFLADADVVITFGTSSVDMFSIIYRKPIINCNFFNEKQDILVEKGLALECKDPDNLPELICKAMKPDPSYEQKRSDFIRDFLYKEDGRAAERISDVIIKLVEKSQSSLK